MVFPEKAPDIYHRIEDRETLRPGFRRGLFSDRAGDNALIKAPPHTIKAMIGIMPY